MRTERDEAQRDLAGHQAETERLRSQLADAEAAVRRLTQAGVTRRRRPRRPSACPRGAPRVNKTEPIKQDVGVGRRLGFRRLTVPAAPVEGRPGLRWF